MVQSMRMTAEHVGCGHPDKFADQVADRILDKTLELCGRDRELRSTVRTAIECLAKDNLLMVSGETKWPGSLGSRPDVRALAREVWKDVGYGDDGDELTVIDHVRSQSADIATGGGSGVDAGGAGDQGVMIGYATDETPEMMPREWVLARDMCMRLRELRVNGELPWLKADCKSQVTLDQNGIPTSVIIAAHHSDGLSLEDMGREIIAQVVWPVLGYEFDPERMKVNESGMFLLGGPDGDVRVVVNGTGKFLIGGPTGDAGVVGRKIVVDAYGPRVPVGGGAYSGKDPSKVDRSAAYMARHIAKTVVALKVGGAHECTVTIAYAIGQIQPEMVTAVTETGQDVSGWVQEHFPDLSPLGIIERLELRNPSGWSYYETASFGHYGRAQFPWEAIAEV